MIGKELLKYLEEEDYKYSEADIVFIARDNTGKIVWLERGNSIAGLEHITQRHKEQFLSAYGIAEN